jgi:hypothetical protein
MEALLLPEGRTQLLLSRRYADLIDLSLLNALYRGARKGRNRAARFRDLVGITCAEGMSLDDELSIIGKDLFGFPANMSERDRELYEEVMPKSPARTGTTWDEMPRIEAKLMPDGRIRYTLARGELSIFAGAIDMMLENLAPDRSRGSRTEVWFCVGGAEIEEVEALRDELRRLDCEVRGGGFE